MPLEYSGYRLTFDRDVTMSSQWPDSLKKLVERTLASTSSEVERSAVQAELKDHIFKAYQEKRLWTVDWDNFQLPSLLKQNNSKKRKATAGPSLVPNGTVEDESRKRLQRSERFRDQLRLTPEQSTSARPNLGSVYGLNHFSSGTSTPEPEPDVKPFDYESSRIIGRNTKLEKPYLRLTGEPDPATIRPLPVLKEALSLVKRKWKSEANYNYACDQFKSIRQDLMVQRIKTEFTIEVYELHARIALEKGDLGEFNQCQGQLRELYKLGLAAGHAHEFLAYRILYLIFSLNKQELNSTLGALTDEEKAGVAVKHALEVRRAFSSSNYVRFFRLFQSAPNMGAWLMDHFLARERMAALATITKAYRELSLDYLATLLAFDDRAELVEFLEQHNAGRDQECIKNAANGVPILVCKAAVRRITDSLHGLRKVDLKGQI